MNAPFFRARPATPVEHGQGYSGPATIIRPGEPGQVINLKIRDIVPNGYYGMASVHMTASDVDILPPGQIAPNSKLIASVHYQSGDSGGDFDADITQGHAFAVGATSALNILVQFVKDDPLDGQPLIAYATKRVETTVCWGTSISPKAAIMTTDSLVLVPGIPSRFVRIPRQAQSMIAQGFPATGFPALIASFASTDLGGAGNIKAETLNPNANGTVIGQGFEFVQFTSPVIPMTVFGVFELWP